MNALQVMDRYRKEVIQVSTWKNDIKVQYLYDNIGGRIWTADLGHIKFRIDNLDRLANLAAHNSAYIVKQHENVLKHQKILNSIITARLFWKNNFLNLKKFSNEPSFSVSTFKATVE